MGRRAGPTQRTLERYNRAEAFIKRGMNVQTATRKAGIFSSHYYSTKAKLERAALTPTPSINGTAVQFNGLMASLEARIARLTAAREVVRELLAEGK